MKEQNGNAWPTVDVVDRYLRGEASPEEVFFVEKTALEHPFFADAVRGYVDTGERPNKKDWTPDPTFNERFKKRYHKLLEKGGIIFLIVASIYLYLSTQSKDSIFLVDRSQTEKKEALEEPIEVEEEEHITAIEESAKDSIMSFDVPAESQVNKQPEAFVRSFTAPEPLQPQSSIVLDSTSEENKSLTIPTTISKIYHIDNYKVVDYRGKRSVPTQNPVVLTGTPANAGDARSEDVNDLQLEEIHVPYINYLEKAMNHFAKEAYVQAWNRYEVILKHFPNDANALFYGGLCNYYLGDYETALELFTRSARNSITTFHEESHWYRAQTMWKAGQREEACEVITEIVQTDGFYTHKANAWMSSHSCD